jgi:hypothetical protein
MDKIWNFLRADKKETGPDEIQELYRSVFGTKNGREVLAHMLAELNFFDEIAQTEEEVTRSNYARHLLRILGVWRGKNVDKIVDAFLQMPYREGK